ncbi:hypothetical protein [Hymenobacter sp.]|uniref:hypothetical protein n=1 Tax=Hymenobacter sp. TaxID=1898978 RepID=UPI00286BB91B|nr:hypothetical protein [Hymenobacter sp.]
MSQISRSLFGALALAGGLSACGGQDKTPEQTAQATAAAPVATEAAPPPAAGSETPPAAAAPGAAFDLSAIPVSSANLGRFPYLGALKGYGFNVPSDSIGYDFERSYIYDGKNLVAVEGKVVRRAYLAADEKAKASNLMISRNYEDLVKGLGGVKVSTGRVPGEAVEKVGREEYEKHDGQLDRSDDDIDTYVIRQKDKEVWVQVMPYIEGKYYQLNVTERAAMPQQAGLVKADELKKN